MINKHSSRGINSYIKELNVNEGKVIIHKKYKDNDKERMNREIKFLLELQRKNIKNVPLLLDSNKEERWITMTHLMGDKIDLLDKEVAFAITRFLNQINHDKTNNKLGYAKDAYLSKYHVASDLKRRATAYDESKKQKMSSEFQKWVSRKLIIEANNGLETIEDSEFWDVQREGLILSPSDLGIHNMLKMNHDGPRFHPVFIWRWQRLCFG